MEKLNITKRIESDINNTEKLRILDEKIEDIINENELEVVQVTSDVLKGTINILNSTVVMQKIAENSMLKVTEVFSEYLGVRVENLNLLILFWFPS